MRVYFASLLLMLLYFLPGNAISESENSVPTYMPLKVNSDHILYVEIHTDSSIPKQNINAVMDAITSEDSFTQEGKLFFTGWKGTLIDAAKSYSAPAQPLDIKIVDSINSDPDVTVVLTNSQSDQGYSGLTTFVTEHGMIKNSHITIYEATDLTAAQISSIARHEFGHALGLDHSTISSDLMYPNFTVATGYISELDERSIDYIYGEVTDNTDKIDSIGKNQIDGNKISIPQLQVPSNIKGGFDNPNVDEGPSTLVSNSTSVNPQLNKDSTTIFVASPNAVPEFPLTPAILLICFTSILLFCRFRTNQS